MLCVLPSPATEAAGSWGPQQKIHSAEGREGGSAKKLSRMRDDGFPAEVIAGYCEGVERNALGEVGGTRGDDAVWSSLWKAPARVGRGVAARCGALSRGLGAAKAVAITANMSATHLGSWARRRPRHQHAGLI